MSRGAQRRSLCVSQMANIGDGRPWQGRGPDMTRNASVLRWQLQVSVLFDKGRVSGSVPPLRSDADERGRPREAQDVHTMSSPSPATPLGRFSFFPVDLLARIVGKHLTPDFRTPATKYLEGEDASDAERGGDRTALDDAISDTVDAQRLLLTSKELLVSSLFALGQAGVVVVDDDRGPLFRALWCVKLPPPSDTSVTPKIAIRSHDSNIDIDLLLAGACNDWVNDAVSVLKHPDIVPSHLPCLADKYPRLRQLYLSVPDRAALTTVCTAAQGGKAWADWRERMFAWHAGEGVTPERVSPRTTETPGQVGEAPRVMSVYGVQVYLDRDDWSSSEYGEGEGGAAEQEAEPWEREVGVAASDFPVCPDIRAALARLPGLQRLRLVSNADAVQPELSDFLAAVAERCTRLRALEIVAECNHWPWMYCEALRHVGGMRGLRLLSLDFQLVVDSLADIEDDDHRQQRTDDLARSYSEAAAHLANLRELRSLTLNSPVEFNGVGYVQQAEYRFLDSMESLEELNADPVYLRDCEGLSMPRLSACSLDLVHRAVMRLDATGNIARSIAAHLPSFAALQSLSLEAGTSGGALGSLSALTSLTRLQLTITVGGRNAAAANASSQELESAGSALCSLTSLRELLLRVSTGRRGGGSARPLNHGLLHSLAALPEVRLLTIEGFWFDSTAHLGHALSGKPRLQHLTVRGLSSRQMAEDLAGQAEVGGPDAAEAVAVLKDGFRALSSLPRLRSLELLMSDVRTFPDDDAATELETALLREVFSLTQLQSLTLESAAKAGYTAPWMVGAPGWTQEGRCKDFLDHCRFTSRHRLREVELSFKGYADVGHCALLCTLSAVPLLKRVTVELGGSVAEAGPVMPMPPASARSHAYLQAEQSGRRARRGKAGEAARSAHGVLTSPECQSLLRMLREMREEGVHVEFTSLESHLNLADETPVEQRAASRVQVLGGSTAPVPARLEDGYPRE